MGPRAGLELAMRRDQEEFECAVEQIAALESLGQSRLDVLVLNGRGLVLAWAQLCPFPGFAQFPMGSFHFWKAAVNSLGIDSLDLPENNQHIH